MRQFEKNNFNEHKIERHLAHIDAKLDEYNKTLANADEDNKKIIEQEIKKHHGRKDNYQNMQRQLAQTGESQISTSNPESRQLVTRNNTTEMAYIILTGLSMMKSMTTTPAHNTRYSLQTAMLTRKVSAEITIPLSITKLQHSQHVLPWHAAPKQERPPY